MTLLLALLAVQDVVKLSVVDRAGDKAAVTMTESRLGTIKRVMNGSTTETEVHDKVDVRFAEEILEATDGRASKVRRRFTEWWVEEISRYTGEPDKSPGPLAGKTVVFIAKDLGTEAEGLNEKDLRRNRLQPDVFVRSLPGEPVRTGARWAVNEKDLMEDLPRVIGFKAVFTSAAAKGAFESLDGSAANVVYTVEARGEQKLLGSVALTLQLTLRVDTSAARLTARKHSGTYAVGGAIEVLGDTYATEGSIELKAEMRRE